PLLAAQGRGTEEAEPGSVWPCTDEDAWIATGPGGTAPFPGQTATDAARAQRQAGIPATALASSLDLVNDAHLRARGFWEETKAGLLPGLPWRTSFGSARGPARPLGADTDAVLHDILGKTEGEIARLRR